MTPTDVPYAAPGGKELLARVYRPGAVEGDPVLRHPAVVEVHGGAWGTLDRTAGELYCSALAGAGFVVVSVDFRQGPDHRHPAGSADVTAAVRWVRTSADELGVDPERIGLVGSSSGGHLALLAAIRPEADEHRGVPLVVRGGVVEPAGNASASVACVAALWPPVDPLARYRYCQDFLATGPSDDPRFRPELLVANTRSYFGDEATMSEASIAGLVRDGHAMALPPAWVAHPALDRNVPVALVDELATAWRDAGGELDVTTYPGEPHAFGHRRGPSTDRFVADLTRFLRSHLTG
jgi:acetyl esterase/lipase